MGDKNILQERKKGEENEKNSFFLFDFGFYL